MERDRGYYLRDQCVQTPVESTIELIILKLFAYCSRLPLLHITVKWLTL
jgi:hypothetical protein